MANFYTEFRCTSCEKLLFKGILIESEVEVKCSRCGAVNRYQGEAASKYLCLYLNCPQRAMFQHAAGSVPADTGEGN